MTLSTPLIASECPHCGAPVDRSNIPATQQQVRCSYCGALLDLPQGSSDDRPLQPIVINLASELPDVVKGARTNDAAGVPGAMRSADKGSTRNFAWGCAMAILILLFTFGIIGLVFWRVGMFNLIARLLQ